MRISLPGTWPLYAQVRIFTPPRSMSVSAGSNVRSTAGFADDAVGASVVRGEQPAATPVAAVNSMNCLLSSIAKAWHFPPLSCASLRRDREFRRDHDLCAGSVLAAGGFLRLPATILRLRIRIGHQHE